MTNLCITSNKLIRLDINDSKMLTNKRNNSHVLREIPTMFRFRFCFHEMLYAKGYTIFANQGLRSSTHTFSSQGMCTGS